MKNLIYFALVAVFLLTGTSVTGQGQKFGHINTTQLFNMLPETEQAERQLQREAEKLMTLLEELQVEYNNKLEVYINSQDTLTNVVRQLRERELTELNTRMQEFRTGAQEDLQQMEMKLLEPIYQKIETAISEVAREQGYVYVFDIDSQGILYHSEESEDILPYVITQLGL